MGDLHSVVNHLPDGQSAPFQSLAKSLALKQLRDQVRRAFVCSHVKHRENVWMIEGSGGPRFLFEAVQALWVSGKIQEHFHRNVAVQVQIARPVYLSHSPNANQGEDFIGSKASASEESHGRRDYTPCAHNTDLRGSGSGGELQDLSWWFPAIKTIATTIEELVFAGMRRPPPKFNFLARPANRD